MSTAANKSVVQPEDVPSQKQKLLFYARKLATFPTVNVVSQNMRAEDVIDEDTLFSVLADSDVFRRIYSSQSMQLKKCSGKGN